MKTLLTCESGLTLFESGINFMVWTEEFHVKNYADDGEDAYVLEVDDSAVLKDHGQSFLVSGMGEVTVKGLYKGD